jgi:excisionase family DNA binding protein
MTKRYTTTEAAEVLGISARLVKRYCKEGRLGEKIGRDYSITEAQLKRFRDKPRSPGRPKQD